MSKVHRSFSVEFKRAALSRLSAGELASKLAAEFGVHRQLIYKWRDAERDGSMGRRRGPPTKAERLEREARLAEASELELARRKVAELERKVGQQAVELDFWAIGYGLGRRRIARRCRFKGHFVESSDGNFAPVRACLALVP